MNSIPRINGMCRLIETLEVQLAALGEALNKCFNVLQASNDKLLTIGQAAEVMGVTRQAVYKMIESGYLRVIRKGNRKFIRLSEIMRDSPGDLLE